MNPNDSQLAGHSERTERLSVNEQNGGGEAQLRNDKQQQNSRAMMMTPTCGKNIVSFGTQS